MIQTYLSFATAVRATASSVQEGMSGVAIQIPAKGIKTTALASAPELQIPPPAHPRRLNATLTLSSPWPLGLQFRMKWSHFGFLRRDPFLESVAIISTG
jgi:hypothetical protein